jgi:hypothetical protein
MMTLEETLQKLIHEQGKTVLDDSRRFNSLISDYLGTEFRNEKRLLQSAVEAGYARELDKSSDPDLTAQKLIRDFEAEYSITPDAARKTITTLAKALGIKISELPSPPLKPQSTSPPSSPPKPKPRPASKPLSAPRPSPQPSPPKPQPQPQPSPPPGDDTIQFGSTWESIEAGIKEAKARGWTGLANVQGTQDFKDKLLVVAARYDIEVQGVQHSSTIQPPPPKPYIKSRSGFPFDDSSFLWKASVRIWSYGSMACIIIGAFKSIFGSGGSMLSTGIFFFAALWVIPKIMKYFTPPMGIQFAVRAIAALIILNTLLFGTFSSGRRRGTPTQPVTVSVAEETIVEPPVETLVDRQGETIRNGISVRAVSENGGGRIYRVAYADDWTVISIIRTTGDHNQISLGEPGAANSFYVEDSVGGNKHPLRALRHFDDTDAGAGADLIFDAINTRSFNLIEGDDVSESAWHFLNVNVP